MFEMTISQVGKPCSFEGRRLWSLERWEEAEKCFEAAVQIYAAGPRSYWLGVAYLCLGAVRNRMVRLRTHETTLERGIKILLKSHDDYNLAVARVNVPLH